MQHENYTNVNIFKNAFEHPTHMAMDGGKNDKTYYGPNMEHGSGFNPYVNN